MWQRFLKTHFWLAAWFAACSLQHAAAQQFVQVDDPSLTAESSQVGCPIRYTLRHFAGQAPGYDTGVTRFELFIPLAEFDGSNLLFCDLQPMLYNDGQWGSNLGLGYRWYSPAFDRVFGLYGYFDYRETTAHRFQQGTLGFDSLGNWIDARGNVYLPNQERRPLPAEAVAPPHFQGRNLLYGGYESAMLGGDCEVGVRMPVIGGTQSRLLGGVYWFDGDGEQDVQGWKARLETNWTANLSTDVAIYDDDVFGTTMMVSIGFNIQTESSSPFQPQIRSVRRGPQRHITQMAADRVAEPVCRLPNIAVRQGEYRATWEDREWQILHVVEGATGGDGSFERPFGTLDQAMAVAQDGYLVYTPYGGTYQPTQMLLVPEGVSLLSNSQVHYVPIDAGWLQLPLSGASPDLSAAPQILGSVMLSDRATLDGFGVVGYGDTLDQAGVVRVVGAADATVANNVIWSRQEGIWIEDARHVSVARNTVVQSQGSGIFMSGATDAALTGNRIVDASGDGIEVLNTDRVNIVGNAVEMATGSGIAVTQGDNVTISENTIGLVGENGIEVLHGHSVNVSGNSLVETLGDGILLAEAANATVTGNAIGLAGRHGIELSDAPNATVADNRIGAAGWHGIAATDGTGTQIRENAIGSAGWDGIHVTQGADVRIAANAIDGTLGNGITLNHSAGAIISNNRIGTVAADGIWVGVATNATVESNVIALAGGRGIRILDGVQASVLNNEVQRAMAAAFELQGTDNAIFTGNRILASGGDGIRVMSANYVEIGRNELEWIDLNGIVVVDSANARITENTIAFAGRDGIQIVDGADLLVSGNAIERAIGNGIDIRGGEFAGFLVENSIANAGTGLNLVLTGGFQGAISDNTLLENRSYGISVEAGQFVDDSFVSTNRIESSDREGIRILVTGPDASTLVVSDNVLILNNAQDGDQHREFVAGLASGAGPMIVALRGNASYNLVLPGEFNFDLFNAGSSTLSYVTDPGAPNLGTIGSSDASVPPP